MQNSSRQIPPTAQAATPRVPSQTDTQMMDAERALEGLDKALSVLNEKIQPVLRPARPNDPSGEAVEEGLVPVADRIRRITKRVISFTQFVESLTERTEA